MEYDYIKWLNSDTIKIGELVGGVGDPLPEFKTQNPLFRKEIESASRRLEEYFGDPTVYRPLNCLLLGPPGSGKSYLARKLSEQAKAIFFEYNLSQLGNPERLAEIFIEISKTHKRTQKPNIVFLDEFDIKVDGSSIIRYLIHPIYEGNYGEEHKFGKTAFIFSGSYLKNRNILSVLQRNVSDFDLLKLLYDLYLVKRDEERTLIREFYEVSLEYQEIRERTAADRDVLEYLRQLDKLTDFLSRINGFILEIADLSSPLQITQNHFVISCRESPVDVPLQSCSPQEVVDFIKAIEESRGRFSCVFNGPSTPILEFKNMLLLERLLRVVQFFESRFKEKTNLIASNKLLNYLTVVPLVHGMRSLEHIISQIRLDQKNKTVRISQEDAEIFRMHIREYDYYKDPESIWVKLEKENPGLCEKGVTIELCEKQN